jgi:hypothetical protein
MNAKEQIEFWVSRTREVSGVNPLASLVVRRQVLMGGAVLVPIHEPGRVKLLA